MDRNVFEHFWSIILGKLNSKADADHVHTIDAELSNTSTNPVQNQAVKKAIDSVNESISNIEIPVQSVNNKTGEVELTAPDVGAVALEGDSSVNGQLFAHTFYVKAQGQYPKVLFDGKIDGTSTKYGEINYTPQHRASINEMTQDGAYAEMYQLPKPADTAEANALYNILTDKNVVTVEQGGTGANTAEGARTKLGALGKDDTAASAKKLSDAPGTFSLLSLSNYPTQYGFEQTNGTYTFSPRIERSNGVIKVKTVSDAGTKFHTLYSDQNKPTAAVVGADPTGTATNKVTAHNIDTAAHEDIRTELSQLSAEIVGEDRINELIDAKLGVIENGSY